MPRIFPATLTGKRKRHIHEAFGAHALAVTGMNGLSEVPIVFEARENKVVLGYVVVQIFWGQLHIKYVLVEEAYRGQGIGYKLMSHALEYGKSRGCRFAFVETMSFQAPGFYRKLGFKVELKRDGYAQGTSFYYLKKDL